MTRATPDGAKAQGGTSGFSLTSRIAIAATVAAVALGAAVHLGIVVLSVAPPNTISTQHAKVINDYVSHEFGQNWKLFAPNPPVQNSDVQARARILKPDGTTSITSWSDLTAMDEQRIRHNPFPSHTKQNELRLAWVYYTSSHDVQNRPIGTAGKLAQEYMRRIVAHDLGPQLNGGTMQLVQVRIVTRPIGSPPWSSQKTDVATGYSVLPWWAVSIEDFT